MLIGDGICDVIWKPPQSPRSFKSKNGIKNPIEPNRTENPLEKFSSHLHNIILANSSSNKAVGQENSDEEFKVQRLMRGDALTVRALSAKESLIVSEMKIAASSKSVKVFSLERSSLKFLPQNIRVV